VPPHRSLIEIDTAAIAANVAALRRLAGPAEVWAVVKADGYGHGAVAAGRAAVDAGATRLCVATLGEAAEVRAELTEVPLIVLSPLSPDEGATCLALGGCQAVLSTPSCWERLRDLHDLDVHVKADTGMGRWGFDPDTALTIGRALVAGPRPERLVGLMSHLATADADDRAFVDTQVSIFRELANAFPPCPRHLANSAATLRYPELAFDAVRPGVATYGIDPMGVDPLLYGLQPALRWTTVIRDIRELAPGASSGYGRRLIADRPCRVAMLPIGYADGYRRGLSGLADVLINGRRCKVAATVSMDQAGVLLPDDADAEVGDVVVLIGAAGDERITAEELARQAGTIPYEVTCGIRPSLTRAKREARP